jgi:hypothetical protein
VRFLRSLFVMRLGRKFEVSEALPGHFSALVALYSQ